MLTIREQVINVTHNLTNILNNELRGHTLYVDYQFNLDNRAIASANVVIYSPESNVVMGFILNPTVTPREIFESEGLVVQEKFSHSFVKRLQEVL